MNNHFQHPLDSIYHDKSILLLEAMIPYVEPSMKLPLALLVKMQEIRTLMQVFCNPSQLDACGLNRNCERPEEFISVLCQAMGIDGSGQFSTMQTMMNTMQMMNAMPAEANSFAMQEPSASKPDTAVPPLQPEASPVSTRDDMINAIRQVLSEQEGDYYESESTP